MNQRKLKPEVDAWISDGLIQPDQGQRILDRYPKRGANYWGVAFGIIGSVLVLCGIILVIASNWHNIPQLVKFGGLLMLLTASFVLGTESHLRGWNRAWPECAFLAASVFSLLGLMLISQIFHVHGHPSGLFLTWTLAISPLPLLSRTATSWIAFLVAAMLALGTGLDNWITVIYWRQNEYLLFTACYVAFGIGLALLSQLWLWLGENVLRGIGEYWGILTAFIASYSYGLGADYWVGVWILVFLAALGLIALAMHREKPHQLNIGFVMVALVILSIFIRLIGDMLNTGLVFIVGGIAILGCVFVLNMLRTRLIRRLA